METEMHQSIVPGLGTYWQGKKSQARQCLAGLDPKPTRKLRLRGLQ